VYPYKILSDFHLNFHVGGAVLPAEPLARTLIVHPESATIVYSSDTFSVRETWFVPVHESGAIVALEVDTTGPLEIEAVFDRDLQLLWPANIGDTGGDWDPKLRAFHFADEAGRFDALVGSPSATRASEEYSSNYSYSRQDSFLLGTTEKGTDTKLIVIAASFAGHPSLAGLYEHLTKDYQELLRDSGDYYRDYLARTVSLHLPDAQLETAYDWARVSMLQGVVQNPFLGEGLVAGYNTSRDDHRPGFAWFFGRDAEWTSLALNAAGDFSTARNAMDFLSKYQRADGKVPHEVSQSASFVEWFKTPWAYASADATPLFIIAVNDYVTRSGDVEFARQKWDNLWRAYKFLQSTRDAHGLAQNVGVGHGWIEGGPFYPVGVELYQASLGVEALRALSHVAHLLDKEDLSQQLAQAFERQQPILDQAFWSEEKQIYTYALAANDNDANRKPVDRASVLATVPMWFSQLDGDHARSMIRHLAGPDQQADWGMRIVSSNDPDYDPGGYHYGTVWPLFTGWASVGEYRYHRPLPAYSNLRANAMLALDGSLGHVAEVLSGKYYQTLATGTPHQMWSAAMVVNSLLSGLLGLQTDVTKCQLDFTPHIPADWNSFSVDNVRLGAMVVNLNYIRTPDTIRLEVQSSGTGQCSMKFSPAVSLRARIKQARLNGRPLRFEIQANPSDQHVTVNLPLTGGRNTVEIQVQNNFELGEASKLPALGSTSRSLRVLSESWTPDRDSLSVLFSGASGETYELTARNPGQIRSVEGAQLEAGSSQEAKVRVQLPVAAPGSDPQATVTFHFNAR
jgi:glycogen debranching enzyme